MKPKQISEAKACKFGTNVGIVPISNVKCYFKINVQVCDNNNIYFVYITCLLRLHYWALFLAKKCIHLFESCRQVSFSQACITSC